MIPAWLLGRSRRRLWQSVSDTTEETADDLSRRYGAAYLPLLTVTAVTAALTMMISGTSIGVVVPDVMGAFGVGQDKAQLMATAFYIAMTVSQLLSVWLGGLLGQRRAFSIALLLFAMASVVGATAEEILALSSSQGWSKALAPDSRPCSPSSSVPRGTARWCIRI